MAEQGAEPARGMTLIEVMVALAVLALVASGVLALVSQNARFIVAAEDRLMASVLADNLMIERLATIAPLDEGEEIFEEEFSGRLWRCEETITRVGETGLSRIDVKVALVGSEQTLASATTLTDGP